MKFYLYYLILFLFTCNCKPPTPAKEKEPDPVKAVEGMKLKKSNIQRSLTVTTRISPYKEVLVSSETSGKITEVNFKIGQKVKKGALLLTVDETIAKANFLQATKALEAAQLNLKATERLFKSSSSSEAELTQAQNQAAMARAQFTANKKVLENCKIHAPITGYIAQKSAYLTAGSLINPGSVITQIIDLNILKAELAVSENEVAHFHIGQPVTLTVPATSQSFTAKVESIGVGVDPQTGSFPIVVKWSNSKDSHIKKGMSAVVRVNTKDEVPTLLVPRRVIFTKESKNAVFVQSEDKKALIKFIRLGRSQGELVEVLDGLKEDNVLITSGFTTLQRGDLLKVSLK